MPNCSAVNITYETRGVCVSYAMSHSVLPARAFGHLMISSEGRTEQTHALGSNRYRNKRSESLLLFFAVCLIPVRCTSCLRLLLFYDVKVADSKRNGYRKRFIVRISCVIEVSKGYF